MGYQIVSIVLSDGTKFDQVVVDSGYITQIKEFEDIPFSEEDIQEIIVTHDKWDFGAGQRWQSLTNPRSTRQPGMGAIKSDVY